MRQAFGLVVVIMAAFCAPSANADTTYTYTGNDFTFAQAPFTTSDSITGWFTTSAPVGAGFEGVITPESYAFSDGVDTFDPTDVIETPSIYIRTDPTGAVTGWEIKLRVAYGTWGLTDLLLVRRLGAPYEPSYYANTWVPAPPPLTGWELRVGMAEQAEGTWTVTAGSPTPEPSSVGLMSTALLALAFVARKRSARSLPPATRTIP
jgi:hypothetical protein